MALRNLHLRESYRSDEDDLVNDFFVPCLKTSRALRSSDRVLLEFGPVGSSQGSIGVCGQRRNHASRRVPHSRAPGRPVDTRWLSFSHRGRGGCPHTAVRRAVRQHCLKSPVVPGLAAQPSSTGYSYRLGSLRQSPEHLSRKTGHSHRRGW